MYWGDSNTDKIEKANLDGNDRTVLLSEAAVNFYVAFTLHAGYIYFTDSAYYQYGYLFYYL